MTAPVFTSSFPEPKGGPLKKKRVLLEDTSTSKRDLRAEVIRKLGVDVDGAADIAEARAWWKAAFVRPRLDQYRKGQSDRDSSCDDIRCATPRSGWPSWSANQNILRIRPMRMKRCRCKTPKTRSWVA